MVEKLYLQEEQKAEREYRYKTISQIKHFTRIKTSKEFARVYHHSSKLWHTPCFVLFYKKEKEHKVGFVASKKIGNAVHRNRAKRLLRAHFIENIDLLAQGSYVLVAKPDLLSKSFLETQKLYLYALKKCSALT